MDDGSDQGEAGRGIGQRRSGGGAVCTLGTGWSNWRRVGSIAAGGRGGLTPGSVSGERGGEFGAFDGEIGSEGGCSVVTGGHCPSSALVRGAERGLSASAIRLGTGVRRRLWRARTCTAPSRASFSRLTLPSLGPRARCRGNRASDHEAPCSAPAGVEAA